MDIDLRLRCGNFWWYGSRERALTKPVSNLSRDKTRGLTGRIGVLLSLENRSRDLASVEAVFLEPEFSGDLVGNQVCHALLTPLKSKALEQYFRDT